MTGLMAYVVASAAAALVIAVALMVPVRPHEQHDYREDALEPGYLRCCRCGAHPPDHEGAR